MVNISGKPKDNGSHYKEFSGCTLQSNTNPMSILDMALLSVMSTVAQISSGCLYQLSLYLPFTNPKAFQVAHGPTIHTVGVSKIKGP